MFHEVVLFQKVLNSELGTKWKTELVDFDIKPFAAASIGQVHQGILKDGKKVAIKIQVQHLLVMQPFHYICAC